MIAFRAEHDKSLGSNFRSTHFLYKDFTNKFQFTLGLSKELILKRGGMPTVYPDKTSDMARPFPITGVLADIMTIPNWGFICFLFG